MAFNIGLSRTFPGFGVPTFQPLEIAAGIPITSGTTYYLPGLVIPPSGGSAVTVRLAAAAAYAILAAAGITNTGSTVITGGVIGSFPTTTIIGFNPPPATVDNADAAAAQTAALAAYNFYLGLATTGTVTTADLGTQSGGGAPTGTYYAGKYVSASSIAISTPIILDAQGNGNALFVFYSTASTITQAIAGTITLINGAQAANVIWLVGSSWTTVGPGAVTQGNILANTSITLGGGILNGRALAGIVTSSGAVTIASATSISASTSGGSVNNNTPGLLVPPLVVGRIRIKIYNGSGTSPTLTKLQVMAYDGTNSVVIADLNFGTAVTLGSTSWFDWMRDWIADTASGLTSGGAVGQLISGLSATSGQGGVTSFKIIPTLGGTGPGATMDAEVFGTVY